jgi:uncharacterized protein YdhG (YjbR/CyaY superfamily)
MTQADTLGSRHPASPPRQARPGPLVSDAQSGRPVEDLIGRLGDADRHAVLAVVDVVGRLAPHAVEGISCGVPALMVDGAPLIGVVNGTRGVWVVPFSSAVLTADSADQPGFSVSRNRVQVTAHQALPRRVLARMVSLRRAEIDSATRQSRPDFPC